MKKIACLLLFIQYGFIMAQETVPTINGKKVQIYSNADNGLTPFNGSIQLGGSLIKPTVLTTTATNTLTIEGLQPGTPLDDIILTDAFGVLKTINAAKFAWNLIGNSGIDATNNFLGTLDNKPLQFKINNTNAGKLTLTSTAFGYNALNPASTGSGCTAIGLNALSAVTTGSSNTAVGASALAATTGAASSNTGV